jgi:hypothetical protein
MVAGEVQARLGEQVVCVPLNGPAGNIAPGPSADKGESPEGGEEEKGSELVRAVASGIESALAAGEEMACDLVRVGVKLLAIPVSDLEMVESFPHLRLTREPPSLNTQVQVVRLGDVAVVGMPGEPMASVGQAVRRLATEAGFRCAILASLANDFIGYYFLPESYDMGGKETEFCAGREEGNIILDGVAQILSKMQECGED